MKRLAVSGFLLQLSLLVAVGAVDPLESEWRLSSALASVDARVMKVLRGGGGGEWEVVQGSRAEVGVHAFEDASTCANAVFHDLINSTGWSFLAVFSNPQCSSEEQAYAAGMVESSLTWERMWQMALNNGDVHADLGSKLTSFLDAQQVWLEKQIAANPDSPYWFQLGLLETQAKGLADGYHKACDDPKRALSAQALRMMLMGGDLETLQGVFGGSDIFGQYEGHCSAFIKLLPDNADLLVSQVTWSSLSSMLRTFKLYSLPYTQSATDTTTVPAVNMTFSSYPGHLYSGDDWYWMSSGLVSMETTIGNSNQTLFELYIKPDTVLEWQRNLLANRLAADGESWCKLFEQHQSGTYNNEWMLVDFNKFSAGSAPPAGTLHVLDQVPGFVQWADVTPVLAESSYFASYNLPYFPKIFDVSGGQANVEKYGPWFAWNGTARYHIFKRNQTQVTDMPSMRKLMRYNNYQHDPLARCECSPPYSGENAVACRSDLNPANGTYPFGALGHRNHAATDAKITSASLFPSGKSWIISGPTYDQQPVFDWRTSDYNNKVSHVGLPDRWEFPWMLHGWD